MSNNNGSGTCRCAVCEHEIIDGYERHIVYIADKACDSEVTRVKETFGHLKFSICLTCYLLAFGVKPVSCDKGESNELYSDVA